MRRFDGTAAWRSRCPTVCALPVSSRSWASSATASCTPAPMALRHAQASSTDRERELIWHHHSAHASLNPREAADPQPGRSAVPIEDEQHPQPRHGDLQPSPAPSCPPTRRPSRRARRLPIAARDPCQQKIWGWGDSKDRRQRITLTADRRGGGEDRRILGRLCHWERVSPGGWPGARAPVARSRPGCCGSLGRYRLDGRAFPDTVAKHRPAHADHPGDHRQQPEKPDPSEGSFGVALEDP